MVSLTAVLSDGGHGVVLTATVSEPLGVTGMSAMVTWSTDSGAQYAYADMLATSSTTFQATATSTLEIPVGASVRVGACHNSPGGSTTVT